VRTSPQLRFLVAFSLSASLLFGAGWYCLDRLREPSYRGKSAAYWFKEFSLWAGHDGRYDFTRREESLEALRAIGDPAVSYLLGQAFPARPDSAAWTNFLKKLNRFYDRFGLPRAVGADVRAAAALSALAQLHPPGRLVLPALRRHLTATNPIESGNALSIVSYLGDGLKDAIPFLMDALRSGDGRKRSCAYHALRLLGPKAKSAVPTLIDLMAAETNRLSLDPNVFAPAITLGKIGSNAAPALPIVKEWLASATDWGIQCGLSSILFQIDDRETNALAFLMNGLTNHEPSNLRWVAALALGEIGPGARAAAPYVWDSIESGSETLVREAPRLFERLGVSPVTIKPNLKGLLDVGNPQTRFDAAAALLQMDPNDRDAQEALINFLRVGPAFAEPAMGELRKAGAAAGAAIPVLSEILRRDPKGKGRAARWALERIQPRPGEEN